MNKWILCLSGLLMLAPATFAQQVQRFGNLPFRETPYSDFVGIHPISEAQAANIKHYELTYDEEGRVIKAAQKVGDQVIRFHPDQNIHYLKAAVTVFSYEENKEVRHFLDHYGDTIVVDNNTTYSEVYEYDRHGNRTSLRYFDQSGQLANNGWGIARYAWKTNGNGSVIEHRFNKAGDLVQMRPTLDFFVMRYQFDERGFADEMVNLGKEGKVPTDNSTGVAKDDITYTDAGEFKSWATYNAKNEPVIGNSAMIHSGLNIHDAFGNVIESKNFDLEGNEMMSRYGFATIKVGFDAYNFISSYKLYDAEGTIKANNGIAYVINEFDRFGNEVESRVYNNNDELTPIPYQGFCVVKNRYDSQNRLIRISYFNEDVQAVNRSDNGTAYIIFDYANPQAKRHYYDKDGKRLKTEDHNL